MPMRPSQMPRRRPLASRCSSVASRSRASWIIRTWPGRPSRRTRRTFCFARVRPLAEQMVEHRRRSAPPRRGRRGRARPHHGQRRRLHAERARELAEDVEREGDRGRACRPRDHRAGCPGEGSGLRSPRLPRHAAERRLILLCWRLGEDESPGGTPSRTASAAGGRSRSSEGTGAGASKRDGRWRSGNAS